MSTKVATILSVKAKAGKRDELLGLFKEHLADRATKNADQEMVVWIADAADPDAFHLFEVYSNQDAMRKNSEADWFAAYMSQVGSLIDGQPEMLLGEPRWIKAPVGGER